MYISLLHAMALREAETHNSRIYLKLYGWRRSPPLRARVFVQGCRGVFTFRSMFKVASTSLEDEGTYCLLRISILSNTVLNPNWGLYNPICTQNCTCTVHPSIHPCIHVS